jgi:hypothetical protein
VVSNTDTNMQEFLAIIAWHILLKMAQSICDGEPCKACQKVDFWLLQKLGISPKIRETIVRELCKVIRSGRTPQVADYLNAAGHPKGFQ